MDHNFDNHPNANTLSKEPKTAAEAAAAKAKAKGVAKVKAKAKPKALRARGAGGGRGGDIFGKVIVASNFFSIIPI